jgi:nucleotide-binding universal stress UspA family protein
MFDVDQWPAPSVWDVVRDPTRSASMIQDLMLPITETAGDANALSAAIALADAQGAHLSVVVPLNLPMAFPGPWGITPDPMLDRIHAELRDAAASKASQLRSQLAKESISWEVRVGEAQFVEPPRAMARQARYADLCVMATPRRDADDGAVARAFFSALLFESGRPILAIPAHHPIELPIRHVVVAWKPTRESTRALHDALPLLGAATSVDVVTVDPDVGDMAHGEDPGVDIATHLARHDLRVNVVTLPRSGQDVSTVLLRHAAGSNAQLLVAGGYGHSRLREWALGGTTRELLQAMHLPVLFSH